MRLRRPRFTIASLMVLVVIASLVSMGIVMRIERNHRLAALQVALANCFNARRTREVAEIAVLEYTEGIYKQDLQTVDDAIALAKSDLESASHSSDGDVPAFEQSRLRLKRLRQTRDRLETYTKDKTVKDLTAEVMKAKAAEQVAQVKYDRLKAAVANPWW